MHWDLFFLHQISVLIVINLIDSYYVPTQSILRLQFHQQFYRQMAYVEQVCEGYGKKSLMGNWFEERLYPQQPFRQNITKAARSKDEGITCFDGTGFQRALPRLERRSKWQTANRIVLDDGIKPAPTVMRAEYPHYEQQSSLKEMTRPFDKNSATVNGTSTHTYSQAKPVQANYHLMNKNNSTEVQNQRPVRMYGSDFKSTLPQHSQVQKFTNYVSQFKGRFPTNEDTSLRNRTQSEFAQSQKYAGNHRQVYPEQTVKPITTLFCENKKEEGDEKQKTGIQRSWVPQKDKALSYSLGRTAEQFKKLGQPQNDIQTSLNVNVGVHKLHPAEVPDNYFRHIRSITVQNNKNPCLRP